MVYQRGMGPSPCPVKKLSVQGAVESFNLLLHPNTIRTVELTSQVTTDTCTHFKYMYTL